MTASDQLLIQRAQKGDTDAFEDLVRIHERNVYNLCFRTMGNAQDAMDASQEALLKAWRCLSSFRGGSAFATWLYRVTVNVCNDMLRKRRSPALSVEAMQETGRDVADQEAGNFADRSVTVQAVSAGLRRLSPEHRAVLVLRDVQGFSYEEIGEILDCPTGTVRSRLNRARRNLADLLRAMEQNRKISV